MRVRIPAALSTSNEADVADFAPLAVAVPAARLAVSLRPYISTEEAADLVLRQPDTLRKSHSLTGTFLGVRPRKVGRRLLWPRAELMALIAGDTASVAPERASVARPVQG